MSEMTPAAQAAAELVAGAARLVEAPEEGEQAAPETTEETPELPSLEADLSGIEEILDEAPEEEPEEEEPPPEEDDPAFDEYDPNQLQAQLKKLKKQNEWLNEQRIKNGLKSWKIEAAKRFQWADLDEIKATSKRSYMKQAFASHQRYAKKLAPIYAELEKVRNAAVDTVRGEVRAEAEQAWGRPTGGPQQPLTERAEAEGQRQHALDRRRYRSVQEMVSARFKHDPNMKDGV
jgi:hypothetical protein